MAIREPLNNNHLIVKFKVSTMHQMKNAKLSNQKVS